MKAGDPSHRDGGARRRLLLLVALLALWVLLAAFRLFRLQVEDHATYAQRADRQQQRIVKLDASRGTIYDARGRELAVSIQVDSAYGVPAEITDAEAESHGRQLAPLLDLGADEIKEQLLGEREFVWLRRKLEPAESEAVRELDLKGVYLLRESKRYYPLGELAAHVLGYVGTDNVGLGGLESYYDKVVAGRTATRTMVRDLRGRFLDAGLSFADAEPGQDLFLTLDATLQHLAERGLERAIEWAGAKAGSVVLLDAEDSAVLAMASYPSFDPNRFTRFPEESWRNRAVMDAFEPGSTFKMITAAAALDERRVDPETLFDCEEGGVAVASVYIRDNKPFGVLSFQEVLARSSNVGVIKVAQRIGPPRFYEQVKDFGFGRPTGIDLPGESAGILMSATEFKETAAAYASFGMGLSVTAVQLANAFACLARGGELRVPYVVAATGQDGRQLDTFRGRTLGRVISQETAKTLSRLLETVVEEGTGKAASVAGYRVSGKTGTAEKSDRRGYSQTGRVASFVGFAPSRRPRLVCLIVLDEPTRSALGGEVAAPAFSGIISEALLYLGIAPGTGDGRRFFDWRKVERRLAEVRATSGGGRPLGSM